MKGEWRFARGLAFLTALHLQQGARGFPRRQPGQLEPRLKLWADPNRPPSRRSSRGWTYEITLGSVRRGSARRGRGPGAGWLAGERILTARSGFPIRLSPHRTSRAASTSTSARPSSGRLAAPERANPRPLVRHLGFCPFPGLHVRNAGNTSCWGRVVQPGPLPVQAVPDRRGKAPRVPAQRRSTSRTSGFQVPNAVIGSAQAGRITALATTNRSIQFA